MDQQNNDMYQFLFENAPIALWEEDYSAVVAMLKDLPAIAGSDISAYFHSDLQRLDPFIAALRVINVNKASLRLFESKDKATLIEAMSETFTAKSKAVFIVELDNLLKGLDFYESHSELLTLKGNRRQVKLHFQINQDTNGHPIYKRILVAFVDVTALHEVQSELWEHNQGAAGIEDAKENILEKTKLSIETQLQQNQRLKSISTLARGVAHEINNPLTGLLNYATFIEEEVKSPQLQEFAAGIRKEGKRVAEIVSNLLTFAQQDPGLKYSVKIIEIVRKAVMLINQSLMTDGIHLDITGVDQTVSIKCRIQDIQHVILNLLTNSWQAINRRIYHSPERKQISVRTSFIEIEDQKYLRLGVIDNGDGIPEEDIENVFDPFFSGQPRTRGVGMGLAVAYGIISENGGQISIQSKIGQGTRIFIDLQPESDPG